VTVPHASLAERDAFAAGQIAGMLVKQAIGLLESGNAPDPVAFERDNADGPFRLINFPYDPAAVVAWFTRTEGWDPGVVIVRPDLGEIQVLVPPQTGAEAPVLQVVMRFRREAKLVVSSPELQIYEALGDAGQWFGVEFASGMQDAFEGATS